MGRRNRKKLFSKGANATKSESAVTSPAVTTKPAMSQPPLLTPAAKNHFVFDKSTWLVEKTPVLKLSPLAFLKWQHMCNCMDVEVGAFGLSRSADSPGGLLYVEDLIVLQQKCSSVSTEFDEDAVVAYYDSLDENEIDIRRGVRIWFHTHPEMSASPSSTDEKTFSECFGNRSWAVMAILSKTNDMYARMTITVDGVRITQAMKIVVDWPSIGPALDEVAEKLEKWKEVLRDKVTKQAAWSFSAQQDFYYSGSPFYYRDPSTLKNPPPDAKPAETPAAVKPAEAPTEPSIQLPPDNLQLPECPEVEILTHESMRQELENLATEFGWYFENGVFFAEGVDPAAHIPDLQADWEDVCQEFESLYDYHLSLTTRVNRTWAEGEFFNLQTAEVVPF